jgi:CRP-like cAMP-binding protein
MYIIRSGEVEVIAQATAGAHEVHIRNLRRPAFFGEMALLTGKPRSATVRAQSDAELFGLSRSGFIELFKSRPEAAKIKEMIAL